MARRTRRFAVATALACLLVAAPARAAVLGPPIAITGSTDYSDLLGIRFDHGGDGVAWWKTSGGLVKASTTTDGGATWSNAVYLPGSTFAVGNDSAGNRIWAYNSSTKLKVERTAPGGLPTGGAGVPEAAVGQLRSVSISVTPAGDALVAYAETGCCSNVKAGAMFWKAGAASPNPVQQLLDAPNGAYYPLAVLDPDGHAAVSWYHNYRRREAYTDDVTKTAPFGTPVDFDSPGPGDADHSGATPDGRAVTWFGKVVDSGLATQHTDVSPPPGSPGTSGARPRSTGAWPSRARSGSTAARRSRRTARGS
jgi:hypothetical protein